MTEPAPRPLDRDTADLGLRAVILYKLVKGGAQLLLALVLAGFVLTGRAVALRGFATLLQQHVSSALAVRAAAFLARFATPRHVELAALALLLDGVLTLVEAWALHTRRWWAEWLVVVASGSLLPYELYEIYRRLRAGRVLIFAINLAIVIYLARRLLRHRRSLE